MKTKMSHIILLASVLVAGTAAARTSDVTDPDLPRSLPAAGPVSVQWTDPAQFTEVRLSHNRWEAKRGNWVYDIAEHVRDSAEKKLPEGNRLDITITDIERAGNYEMGRAAQYNTVRIMRDIYPPRMSLSFTLTSADGKVLAEGERKISDLGYLHGPTPLSDTDPLRYEKRMIDDWLRREFKQAAVASN